MNLRNNMKQLYKTFGSDYDQNFQKTKDALKQLRKENNIREGKLIMMECITALIELKQKYRQTIEIEEQIHQKISARNALGTLSYSEYRIILHILDELNNQDETIIVASQIADKIGITRSVAVNALKKLQSGKVFETKSKGAKGTLIKLINPAIYKEVEHLKIIHSWKI
ncbi:replication/maintenance protein RepL [Phascolarctobacterium succinatutens]|uniref:replication/maintenance protein RepL n=2 Tax=Phascolarctobacterium succinatutens TaxID=626940 RepID=UPI0026EC1F6B|nr:HTH domain-containing protein [Phascolarctobacterium succinatutens]